MTVAPAPTAQVYQAYVRGTPEQLWAALTEPDQIGRYLYGSIVDRRLEPGGHWLSYSPDGSALWNDGLVVEVRAPWLLVHTWQSLWVPEAADEPYSQVTWAVEPTVTEVCRITVRHDHLEASPHTARSVVDGWTWVVSGLKTWVETGRPLGG